MTHLAEQHAKGANPLQSTRSQGTNPLQLTPCNSLRSPLQSLCNPPSLRNPPYPLGAERPPFGRPGPLQGRPDARPLRRGCWH